jgi:hypothetical protein
MSTIIEQADRRTFLKTTSGMVAGLALGGSLTEAMAKAAKSTAYDIPLGVYAAYDKADFLRKSGCTYIEESVAGFLIPRRRRCQLREKPSATPARSLPY